MNAVAVVLCGSLAIMRFAQGNFAGGWAYAGVAGLCLVGMFVNPEDHTRVRLFAGLLALLSGAAVLGLIVLAASDRGDLGSQIGLIILLLPWFALSTWTALRGTAQTPPSQRE